MKIFGKLILMHNLEDCLNLVRFFVLFVGVVDKNCLIFIMKLYIKKTL